MFLVLKYNNKDFYPPFTTKSKRGVTRTNFNFYEIKTSLTWNIFNSIKTE